MTNRAQRNRLLVMTAMVAAVMPAMMSAAKATESVSAMATMVATTERNERESVSVTIESTPPIMTAVVSAVMAMSRLLHHA